MQTVVRPATENDFGQLFALVQKGITETLWAGVPVDVEAIRRLLYASESQEHLFCVRVAEQGDKLVGFVIGAKVGLWFNPAHREAQENLVYVEPAARMSTIAQDLVWAFSEWAKDVPVRLSPTGKKLDAVSEFLTRMGFSRIGSLYRKSASGEQPQYPSRS